MKAHPAHASVRRLSTFHWRLTTLAHDGDRWQVRRHRFVTRRAAERALRRFYEGRLV